MGSRRIVLAVLGCAMLALAVTASAQARVLRISEYKLSTAKLDQIRRHQMDRLLATHRMHTWAPIPTALTNRDLKLMGLPSKRFLLGKRFPVPTAVYPDGRMVRLTAGAKKGKPGGGGGGSTTSDMPLISFAGTGFFGIRPGAWLLTVTDKEIGWCSMAHVYGAPGSYAISTAGHCGKSGDIGTVIGVVGDHSGGVGVGVPVLLDFGKYCKSTGDGGIGHDWALICVYGPDQPLVTPTMAFWGGPIGMFTSTGSVVSANLFAKNGPSVSVNPNPTLVQQIVHYGHGAGLGAGGTPRSGTGVNWFSNYFTYFGAITPGDSGSGSNVLTGDQLGDNREAAGINTHIFVDSSLRTGLGNVAGTRATLVQGTLANGQIVPYPVPLPIGP